MLVVTRKPQESIIVETENGTKIRVVLLSTKPNAARIGIEAPKNIKIIREEIKDKKPKPAKS